MSASERGENAWPYTGITAAAAFSITLFIPIVLAGLPSFPFPFSRVTAILAFLIGVPLVFSALALYRVFEFYGHRGSEEQE